MSSTPSNFDFLAPDWPALVAEARRAEAAALASTEAQKALTTKKKLWEKYDKAKAKKKKK